MSAEMSKAESSAVITWKKKIPLLTNVFMLKDFATVLIIAGGLMLAFLLLITGGELAVIGLWAACMVVVGLLLVFTTLVVFFNRVNMEFGVGPEGILTTIGSRESKINSAVTIIGILTGNMQVAGAGLLAGSRETTLVRWPEIRKVTVYRGAKVVSMRIGMLTPMRLYCDDASFEAVVRLIREKAKKATFAEK